jgi:hypothetical protein
VHNEGNAREVCEKIAPVHAGDLAAPQPCFAREP